MRIQSLLLGAAALIALSTPMAFAEDYAGGAIKTMDGPKGAYLTDAKGMTLYIYDKDTKGVSNCYDTCAEKWPPLMAGADAKAEGDFNIVDRTDGSKMWAYKGMPLYLWVNDKKPGDLTGDGVGKVWHTALE